MQEPSESGSVRSVDTAAPVLRAWHRPELTHLGGERAAGAGGGVASNTAECACYAKSVATAEYPCGCALPAGPGIVGAS